MMMIYDDDGDDMMMMMMIDVQTFRNWINHFGFDPYINDLYYGLADGLLILRVNISGRFFCG